MPLPEGRTPWPPHTIDGVYDTYRQWDAWYTGDPEQLRAYYGAGNPGPAVRASQYMGGMVGALARWFWGRPTDAAAAVDNRLHVPLPADIATTSADLLFGEQVDLVTDDARAQQRLAEIADDGLHTMLLEAAEVASALAGTFLRVVWDATLADHPWIDPVHPDAAIPEWRWGRLAAVTFWREVGRVGADRLRLLERHEPGRIEYGLYQGSGTDLGRRVPLEDSPASAPLAARVDAMSGIDTGVPRLTVVYVPNVRPSRRWRNSGAAPLGRSDYDNVEHLFDALDEVYSSWMRDVRLAKGRVIVPAYMLEGQGRGQGAIFPMDREVFVGVNAEPGSAQQITTQQFAIRVADHRDTAQELVEVIVRSAGYSPQTFGEVDPGAATATEVQARERRSFVTRDKKIRYWRPALAEICETMLAVDAVQFGTQLPTEVEVSAHWSDGVSEGVETTARTAQALRQAEAASTDTLVRMLHPDWSPDQVAAEVAAIQGEAGRTVANPDTFTGA